MRYYAQETGVPVSRSRGEIDRLLRAWGAQGIQWSDDFKRDTATLRFIWNHKGTDYLARFAIHLPGRKELEESAVDGRTGQPSERKMEKLLDMRGKQEHRLLLLWLKAALNAVEAGIIDAAALFLPFLEDRYGKTVAEIAVPQLPKLTSGSATKLLSSEVEK